MSAAIAALMLAGTVHEWVAPAPVRTPSFSAIPAARADSSGGGGSICLETKFFLPFRSEERSAADNKQREVLYALLTTYEHW